MKKLIQTLIGVVLAAIVVAIFSSHAHAATTEIPECALRGGGIVTAAWVKHRIFIGDEPVFGANDLDTVSAHLKELRQAHLCR